MSFPYGLGSRHASSGAPCPVLSTRFFLVPIIAESGRAGGRAELLVNSGRRSIGQGRNPAKCTRNWRLCRRPLRGVNAVPVVFLGRAPRSVQTPFGSFRDPPQFAGNTFG